MDYRPIDRLTKALMNRPNHPSTDWLIHRWIDGSTDRLANALTERPIARLIDGLTERLLDGSVNNPTDS